MQQYSRIDAKTASKMQMTPEEAQAVIELWAVHQRFAEPGPGMTTVGDVAEGLTIPPSDVKAYLSQIRATQNRRIRPPRSKATDIRLSILAVIGFVAVVACVATLFRAERRYAPYVEDFPTYAPTVAIADPSSSGSFRSVEGMSRIVDRGYGTRTLIATRSTDPPKFVFGLDREVFVPNRPLITNDREVVLDALHRVAGGALADQSVVPIKPITVAELTKAFQSAPSDEVVPVGFASPEADFHPPLPDRGLLQWKSVQVGYGGKVTQANVPFARVSDPGLIREVEKEQKRILGQLADAAISISGRPDSPAPSATR